MLESIRDTFKEDPTDFGKQMKKKDSKITLKFLTKRYILTYTVIYNYSILMYITNFIARTKRSDYSRNYYHHFENEKISTQRILIDLLKVLQLVRDKTGI